MKIGNTLFALLFVTGIAQAHAAVPTPVDAAPARGAKAASLRNATATLRTATSRASTSSTSTTPPIANVGHTLVTGDCLTVASQFRAGDQVWIVSCRSAGCSNLASQVKNLQYWQYLPGVGWQRSSSNAFFASVAPEVATTFYVHGNRVDNSEARRIALRVYQSTATAAPSNESLQFVLWSWPSDRIAGGQLEDIRVKAQRTATAGYYLGWVVSQLPPDARVTLVGYSFGARVVTGSLHALAGGRLAGNVLPAHAPRSTLIGTVLIAAAVDDDWLRPGMPHSLATSQIDRLLMINNSVDSALRHYHLLYGLRRTAVAMGSYGPAGYAAGGFVYEEFDAACIVGKEHNWELYFGSPTIVRRLQPTLFASSTTQKIAKATKPVTNQAKNVSPAAGRSTPRTDVNNKQVGQPVQKQTASINQPKAA